MEEFSLGTFVAVFEEMFGPWLFWALVAVAVAITLAYAYVLVRDHGMGMRRFLLAQMSMPIGGVAAVAFVLWITKSRLADVGGPIDWIVLLGVGMVGAGGFSILVYVMQSLVRGRQDST
ncbi:MAG: DUF5368 domain-containing protein [Alkalilacustris sp.]